MAVLDEVERARLAAAYRRTAYRVCLPGDPAILRIDMPWPAIDSRLTQGVGCLAYVTAVNPASQPLPTSENARRQRALLDEIMAMGCVPQLGVAVADDGEWPDEPGFLVAGLSREAAQALASRYGQNAFLYAQAGDLVRLVWCV